MENDILNLNFFDSKLFLFPESTELLKSTSGSNQKSLLVVYNKDSATEANLELLAKILSAVKYNLAEDVLSLPISKGKMSSFIGLTTKERFEHVLVFGCSPTQIGLNFQVQKYTAMICNDCCFLFVDDLADIAKRKELKASLWQCLQKLFLGQPK